MKDPKDESPYSTTMRQYAQAGAGAGLVLGLVVGGTLWTHTPDTAHLMIALGIILFCLGVGAIIGKVVAGIQGD
jgi:hypothetical protein